MKITLSLKNPEDETPEARAWLNDVERALEARMNKVTMDLVLYGRSDLSEIS